MTYQSLHEDIFNRVKSRITEPTILCDRLKWLLKMVVLIWKVPNCPKISLKVLNLQILSLGLSVENYFAENLRNMHNSKPVNLKSHNCEIGFKNPIWKPCSQVDSSDSGAHIKGGNQGSAGYRLK